MSNVVIAPTSVDRDQPNVGELPQGTLFQIFTNGDLYVKTRNGCVSIYNGESYEGKGSLDGNETHKVFKVNDTVTLEVKDY